MNVNVNFVVIQIKSGKRINVDERAKKQENVCKRDYIWNPSTCICDNGKYLNCIVGDSVNTCDEFLEETKTVPTKTLATKPVLTNFNKNKVTCEIEAFSILRTIFNNYHIANDNF